MKALIIVILATTWSGSIFAVDHDPGSPVVKNLAIGQEPGAAMEHGDAQAWAMLCATEENLSPRLQRLCATTFDSLDKLKAATFTGCALATQTVARLLIAGRNKKDAIDYYQKATNDYLAGAQQLVDKDEFKTILADETRKLRARTTTTDDAGAEVVLQRARQCAKALDGAS